MQKPLTVSVILTIISCVGSKIFEVLIWAALVIHWVTNLEAISFMTTLVQHSHNFVVMLYLKLLFGLRLVHYFAWACQVFRLPSELCLLFTAALVKTTYHQWLKWMLNQPALIKVFLRAVSSSLKFAGLPTVVCNKDPAHVFALITQRSTNILTIKSYIWLYLVNCCEEFKS